MHVVAMFVARARFVLARRPWLYWLAVAALAVAIAAGVRTQLTALDRATASWGDTRRVLVADGPLSPGDTIVATPIDVPVAIVPTGALTELPADARLRQHVGAGEIIVALDVTSRPGPAAGAHDGTIVVAVADPTARASIGLAVAIAADGTVLAHHATVTDLADGIVYVAVDEQLAATIAAAALDGRASLMYLP